MLVSRFHRYEPGCCIEVTGPDAAEFLQGQFSNDLSKMVSGEVVYGLWLDRKGKVLADSFVLCRAVDSYLLASVHCAESVVQERLDAYLIMEEVELAGSSAGARGVCVLGEAGQRRACELAGLAVPEKGQFAAAEGVVAFWGRRGSEPALEFVATGSEAGECIEKLDAGLRAMGAMELDGAAMLEISIRGKVPQIGLGFGAADLPQELGLDKDAVSFRKGCYLGQEVMARLHAMGKVRKGLAIFSIEESDTIALGELPVDLLDESGKRVGQLRSAVYPKSGGIGLGVLSFSWAGEDLTAGGVRVKRLVDGGSGDE